MRLLTQRWFLATVATAAVAIALPAVAQRVRQPVIKENPYRDMGGSCVVGTRGEVLYAPPGADCGARQETAAEEAKTVPSNRPRSSSLALRKEMLELREDHAHMAKELREIRLAIALDRKADALQASDHLVQELTEHLAREDRLFEALSAAPANRAPN